MRDRLVKAMSALSRVVRSAASELWGGVKAAPSKLWGWVREAPSGLWRWFRKEAWSARVVALLGLLLALVSAIEQGFLKPIIDPSDKPENGEKCELFARGTWGTCWSEWSGWATLGLTLALLAASFWFGADIRRMRKRSALVAEFQARALDLEALHPDAVIGTLATRHSPHQARVFRDDLRKLVAEVNTGFARGAGLPRLEKIQQLAKLAEDAAEMPRPSEEKEESGQSNTGSEQPTQESEPSDAEAPQQEIEATTIERSPETDTAWESVARLAAATRQLELDRSWKKPIDGQSESPVQDSDPRNRWTGLVGMATLLVGLVAAPTVADELTGDDENGVEQSNVSELEGQISELEEQISGLENMIDGFAKTDTGNEQPEDEAEEGVDEEVDEQPTSQGGDIVLVGVPSRFGVEVTVGPGDSIWELVQQQCGTDDTGPTADQVIRTWDANVEIVGSNPNEIDVEQMLVILCPSTNAGDGG